MALKKGYQTQKVYESDFGKLTTIIHLSGGRLLASGSDFQKFVVFSSDL